MGVGVGWVKTRKGGQSGDNRNSINNEKMLNESYSGKKKMIQHMWASGMLNFLTWGVVMQILALELQMYTKLHARFMLKKQNTVLQNNTQKVT